MKHPTLKKALMAGVSAALVAVLAIAATAAWLQSSTGDVVNTFSTNGVTVSLEETTDGNYSIVPGTSEEKDPTVTVDNSVDSYVFVKIDDAANTEETTLIQYAVAEGWTELTNYPGVYYREVATDAETKEFDVLAGNTVSYPASLTNEDMPEGDVTLTFTAYAIQQAGFESAEAAWLEVPVTVQNEAELQAALNAAGEKPIQLTSDITVSAPLTVSNSSAVLDLNGCTISNETEIWNYDVDSEVYDWSLISVGAGADLTINGDGAVRAKENDTYAVDVRDGGKLTINGGTYVGNIHSVYVLEGELVVNGGTFSIQQTYSSSQPYDFVLNCYDANYTNGSAKITVTGGAFQNYAPANSKSEYPVANFVAPGYESTAQESGGATWYTVVPNTETP